MFIFFLATNSKQYKNGMTNINVRKISFDKKKEDVRRQDEDN